MQPKPFFPGEDDEEGSESGSEGDEEEVDEADYQRCVSVYCLCGHSLSDCASAVII